jgi:hypothetical protein
MAQTPMHNLHLPVFSETLPLLPVRLHQVSVTTQQPVPSTLKQSEVPLLLLV